MKFLRYDDVIELMKKNDTHPYQKDVMDKIFNAVKSIYRGFLNKSKIMENDIEGNKILNYPGMLGKKTKHLYNNLLELPDAKYLEIGTWDGSSTMCALYKNNITGLFIDNWSALGGNRKVSIDNITNYLTKESDCHILENDYWKVDTNKIRKDFNIYLYNSGKDEQDHYHSLNYYYDNLQDNFIFIVNNWCVGYVRDGTWSAINDLDLKVRFCHESFVSLEEKINFPNHSGKDTWWNGIAIFVLEK